MDVIVEYQKLPVDNYKRTKRYMGYIGALERKKPISKCWLLKMFEKEKAWEEKAYAVMQALLNKCPPISKAVIGVLLSILLSLLGDCIYDGIKNAVRENVVEERMVEESSEEKVEDERGF